MRKLIFVTIWICTSVSCFSQIKGDTVTNATIVQLKKAGLSSEIIKAKIQNSTCNFDMSTEALIALKKNGIADDVISTMLNNTSSSKVKGTSSGGVDSTRTLPGIYFCKGQPCELTELEASVYSQAKSGSGLLTGLTYGIAKTKMKATLSGGKANLQIEDQSPIFYFYFDKNRTSNFGNNESQGFWFANATSPNEFLLVKFTTTKKAREVVTGSWNSYEGMSSGIDDDNRISFKYEKISQGIYKVYTEKALAKGEYCFMYAGGTATYYGTAPLQKVYDFGVK